MALWGNNDNVTVASGATAYISSYTKNDTYGGYPVVGAGSSWGLTGYAQTGDVIRFGAKDGNGGLGTYYGDAVINNIQSTTSCYIASTEGLSANFPADSGVNTTFVISQLPVYTALSDPSYSESTFANREAPSWKEIPLVNPGIAVTNVSAGSSIVPFFNFPNAPYSITPAVKVGDYFVNNSVHIKIAGIGTGTIAGNNLSPVGTSTFFFSVADVPGLIPGNVVQDTTTKVDYLVLSIGSTGVALGDYATGTSTTISSSSAVGNVLLFKGDNLVSLASTISSGISTSDVGSFQREMAGYDKVVYGIGKTGVANAAGSQYQTDAGWVGIMTYMDGGSHEMRVKGEVLVAMSGIMTGNAPAYPPIEY